MNIILGRFRFRLKVLQLIFLYKSPYKLKQVARMGLLTEGNPLPWPKTKAFSEHVRHHGIEQFINLYSKLRDRTGDVLKWGDEVEYMIVKFDDVNERATVSLRAQEILPILQEKEHADPQNVKSLWRPEFGSYMVEGTPGKPYGGLLAHFNIVEANMRHRRAEAATLLKDGEVLMSITNFPRLGCPNSTSPPYPPTPYAGVNMSHFLSDETINHGHPRFTTLALNTRERRGEPVTINVPVYRDTETQIPVDKMHELLPGVALPDCVYMDAMGFGMGCCCLQLTFQACCITEARTLYDQLAPLCPIMLALSAASPVFRGHLTEVDCRWSVISGSVDDRTREERGLDPLVNDKFRIHKSRYDSIDSYLSPEHEKYNDIPIVHDASYYRRLREGGIDHPLAMHVAHLFIRDSVVLFSEQVQKTDKNDTDHFENIQSTNWQTMRFKPPPPNSPIGWRVEFRPCEVQLTDFENAAYVCFVVLLTRVILSYNLNFVMPISKVDENMQRAQKRDACRNQKFWWRRDVGAPASVAPAPASVAPAPASVAPAPASVAPAPASVAPAPASVAPAPASVAPAPASVAPAPASVAPAPASVAPAPASVAPAPASVAPAPASVAPAPASVAPAPASVAPAPAGPRDDHYDELTINQIINGQDEGFPGLIPLIESYLSGMDVDADTHCSVQQYLKFIQRRAAGEIYTMASWIRNFVTSHPQYKKDSIVTEKINYDLLKTAHGIQTGSIAAPNLLGSSTVSKTNEDIPKAFTKMMSKDCS